jgi:AcrR family transcriptional regulator
MKNISQANDMDTEQRTLRADAKRNHQLLVRAAREVFAELGPDAPLDEIARRAGVGIGTLYRHFPARYDLQEAVMSAHVRWLLEVATAQLSNPDPLAGLIAFLKDKLACSREYQGLGAAVWLVVADKPADFSSLCTRMQDALDDLLTRAQQAGAVRGDISSKQLLRLINGIALSTEKSTNRDQDMAQLLAIVIDGLRTPVRTHQTA